jgi:hypothetical protein
MVEVLMENNLNPSEYLNEAQKEALAEAEYIEHRKKMLGKI